MSIASTSVVGGAAGSPLAQGKGSELQRSQHETAAQQRQVQSQLKAEAAAGIGATDGDDNQVTDRDADGRRSWDSPPAPSDTHEAAKPTSVPQTPSGPSGNQLDLTA
jgi:hypothetical protein